MGDYLEQYERHLRITLGRAAATVETYLDLLSRLDRDLPEGLAYACADELEDAIHRPRRRRPGRPPAERAAATRALYRAAAAGFFRWATSDDGPLDYDPTVHLPAVRVPARVPRPISTAELADILERACEPYRTWYLLAAGCGLRCVEISALDREHVGAASVWVHGKGGRQRVVPTHPQVWAIAKNLAPGPVARRADGSRASRKEVKDRGNRHLQRRLGLPEISMHRLRHYFGTNVYQARGEFVAQTLLGHASPATTAMYAAVAGEALVAAVAAIPIPVSAGAAGDVAT